MPFYTTIQNDDLAYLFAYLHFSYNSLFEFLNNKISLIVIIMFIASRELIFVIDLYNKLHKSLNKTKYEFILDKNI